MKSGLIALITWGSGGGPFPRLMRWLAEGLRSKGRRIDIIFLRDPKGRSEVDEQIREIGFQTRGRWAVFPLLRYFRETRPSLVIATPGHVVPAALIAGRLSGVPVVPWEQTLLSYDAPFLDVSIRHILPIIRQRLYRWAAAIAAVSGDVAREIKGDVLGKHIFLLPNPCCVDCISKAAGPVHRKKSELRKLVTAGRLVHQKGIDVVLRALSLLQKNGVRNWYLEVLGDGPMRGRYEKMVKQLGLHGRVSFLGYVPNPYPRMAESDIFVHAARWEGFGMVVVEAMALGIPVVAASCPGGVREILEEGRVGRLVPPEDPEALAKGIAELIENEDERQRLREAALRRLDFYRPERIAERVLSIEEHVYNERERQI